MDNLSHFVTGLAVGELIHRSLPAERGLSSGSMRRRLLLTVGAVASNFPDLDLVLTPLLPQPLGYLLHHRGHTHTVLYAIPQALLLWACIWLLWPSARALLKQSCYARRGFALALCVGFALHLLMDSLNSYGIHPFHPYDSRWFFGDMVFILEPIFWVAFGVPMAMMVPWRWLKLGLTALLIGVPLYFTIQSFLPWISMLGLVLVACSLAWLQHRSGVHGRGGLIAALVVGIAFVGMQYSASNQARQTVVTALHNEDQASLVLDAAMTSFPTNPLCWSFVSVQSNELAGTYRLRRGVLSLMPGYMPVAACPSAFLEPQARNADATGITWVDQEEGALDKLRELRNSNCHFEAWLRFARAPSVQDSQAADLRFASSRRGNFTTIDLEALKKQPCSSHVPHWDFPRSDLLGQR